MSDIKVVEVDSSSLGGGQKQVIRKWSHGMKSKRGDLDLDKIVPKNEVVIPPEPVKAPAPAPGPTPEPEAEPSSSSEEEIEEKVEPYGSSSSSDDDDVIVIDKKLEDKTDSETSTTDILSNDPLYLVLSEVFLSTKGNNIVDVLEKIHKDLKKLLAIRTIKAKHKR